MSLHSHHHGALDPEEDLTEALPPSYLLSDGSPRLENIFHDERFFASPLPVAVANSVATAIPLFRDAEGNLGADVLHVPANQSFPLHVHPGDHMLLCLKGTGTVTIDGHVYKVRPGDFYMVPGGVEHAVGAGPEGHWLVSIGAPHVPVLSKHRMVVVEAGQDYSAAYQASLAAYRPAALSSTETEAE